MNYTFGPLVGGAMVLFLLLVSCGPKPPEEEESQPSSPQPSQAQNAAPTPAPVARTTPPPTSVGVAPMKARAPESALALEHRYFAHGTGSEAREEIIGDLAALEATETLQRVFRAERRLETKIKVLEVFGDFDKERHRDATFALLREALQPNQNRLLREVALAQLADLEDPRATALVDATARGDSDRELRAAAAEIRDARQP